MKEQQRQLAEGILYTDQYQMSMSHLYFRMGLHERPAQFDHFFRNYPDYGNHKAGYCINAGLDWLLDWMEEARFRDEDLDYLKTLKGPAGKRVFEDDFLGWLRDNGDLSGISLEAIPEGRVVHPNTPLTVARGPLSMAQILETPLLNFLNFQTLIATKASRIHLAGRGKMMLEFGLRRGHDKGANAGARAALIGGADFTSNIGVSYAMGVPPKGTHAHSMVQVFMALGEGELGAFRAFADVYPDNCILLVDTIDTLESGIPNAIKVFEELKQKGHKPMGVRLDSGDLAHLSIQASKQLDAAGFEDVKIVLSNQLDELTLWQIISQIEQEAPLYGVDADALIERLVYGVGTRLITSEGDSALDGVYKLVGVKSDSEWVPAIKVSESASKTPNPGNKRVWRLYDDREKASVDMICINEEDPREMAELALHHPARRGVSRTLRRDQVTSFEPLLEKVFENGRRLNDSPSLDEMRERRKADLDRLDPGVKRIMNPHIYHVSISDKLWKLKEELIESAKQPGAVAEAGE